MSTVIFILIVAAIFGKFWKAVGVFASIIAFIIVLGAFLAIMTP